MAKPSKDYAAIAAKHIIRPADVKSKPRILVYSRNKKGKTTFAISAGVERTLVLDPEAGTKEMLVKNPHVWPIDKWSDMEEAYEFLRFGDHQYEWVAVDGITKMSNMSLRHVMRIQEERSLTRIPGFVEQRDYGKSGELMKDMLTRFHNLPMGIVFTAQERQVEAADSEEDEDMESLPSAYVPDLPKGVRGTANAIVDVIGRIYVVKNDNDEKERRLWLGESVRYDTGYRSEFVLPDYIRNPTVPKLVRLMRTGSARTTTKGKK